jgi:hypothetical protein
MRTEGLIDPPKEIAEPNYINTKEWKVGREGPVKLSFPGVVDEGETRIMEVCITDSNQLPNSDRTLCRLSTKMVSREMRHL